MNHLDNFGTNLTSGTSASDTSSPVNSVPSIAAPFWVAFDATNINNHYETKLITSKTATNILHSALSYDHTTAEEVRIVNPAAEFDALSTGWQTGPGTWTYSSADSPTFVLTTSVDLSSFIGVGARIKLTQTTEKFFIVTAISGTTITLYGGTDYTLTAAAITSPYFSIMKAPIGFPLDPTKWSVLVTDATQRSGAITGSTWTNIGSTNAQITIPIGVWDVYVKAAAFVDRTSTGTGDSCSGALSTASNTNSDPEMSSMVGYYGSAVAGSSDLIGGELCIRKTLVLAAKTLHYLNWYTQNAGTCTQNPTNFGGTMVLRAVCAYL